MSSPPIWTRFVSAAGLLLGLLTFTLGLQPATAQSGDSSIEVHNRICPTDYEGTDLFEDCHDNVPDPGLPFTFTNEDTGEVYEGTTNENGNIGFANLSAGTYTITGGAPGEFTETAVYCAVGTASEPNQEEIAVTYVTGGIQFDLPAGTNVICDWYTIPLSQGPAPTATPAGDSSIEVHNRTCPVEYDGTSYFDDCHGNVPDPGLPFTFTNEDTGATFEGTTNENGNIGFANLSAGTFTITGGAPGEFAERVVYCAVGTADEPNQEEIPVTYVTGGIQFELPAGTNVICDWYNVPYDLQGNPTATAPAENVFDLPVYTLLCEEDPGAAASDFVMGGVLPDGCEQYGGASVTIATQGGETYGTCETTTTDPCYVTVDIGVTVVASIDPATLPDGYTVVDGQTKNVEIPPASEAWVLFVAVPATPEPTVVTTPTATLPPVEGRNVVIHEGTCGPGEVGSVVVELTDLTAPETGIEMNGGTDMDIIIAESSNSVVEYTLDELMEGEYVVIAYTDDEAETPVACTPIGGEVNDRGELVLGLQEVNDSGFAGIVYLQESGENTGISVFLAEGLAEDEDDEPTATPTPTAIG